MDNDSIHHIMIGNPEGSNPKQNSSIEKFINKMIDWGIGISILSVICYVIWRIFSIWIT